jgi:histidinol-phosphate aminotransferase
MVENPTQKDILQFVRPHLRGFKPYSSARSLHKTGVLLDANENATNLYSTELPLNRYPDGDNIALRTELGAAAGLRMEQVFAGNGSDESIDLLIRIFCGPDDAILICPPTYGMYTVSARFQNTQIVEVPLLPETFALDVPAIQAALAAHPEVKLVFLCSPNNPTGQVMDTEAMLEVIRNTDRPVVVDEAYVEYTGTNGLADYLATDSNLILIRTLSKAWALAGCRIGYCYAPAALIALMQTVKSPYNLNQMTTRMALSALRMREEMLTALRFTLSERERLIQTLKTVPAVQKIYPSDANFLLVKIPNATALQAQLVERKIIVRDRSMEHGLMDCLRISVGAPAENQFLVKTLKELTR